jgi:hypothetical protein
MKDPACKETPLLLLLKGSEEKTKVNKNVVTKETEKLRLYGKNSHSIQKGQILTVFLWLLLCCTIVLVVLFFIF